MKESKGKTLFWLHGLLMVYSFSTVFSKLASGEPFLSFRFCLYYSVILILLGFYAICWQQIIRKLPLTLAFANKAVTVVWGLIWGSLLFHEQISGRKLIGAALVIAGIVLFGSEEGRGQND